MKSAKLKLSKEHGDQHYYDEDFFVERLAELLLEQIESEES